ncbi:MAG: TatD family hydrolase, partial [Deltaproteobacteria bacterium]|nr:TatD family hydrolase [Deltaproteobacteria bacterium]
MSRARSEGVDFIVTVGTNLRLSSRAVALAEQYENIFATVGIHPHDVAKAGEDTLDALKQLVLTHKKIVAYGEIGLDYFRNISRQEIQVEMFGQQLDLVKELNLPVVIHDREAHRQSLDMIQASGVRRGVFHCFSGDYDMARKC